MTTLSPEHPVAPDMNPQETTTPQRTLSAQQQRGLSLLSHTQAERLLQRLASEPGPDEALAEALLSASEHAQQLRHKLNQIGLELNEPVLRQNAAGQPLNLAQPVGMAVFSLRPASRLRPEHSQSLSRETGPLTDQPHDQHELVLTGQGLHEVLTWGSRQISASGLLTLLGRIGNRDEAPVIELRLSHEQLTQISLPARSGQHAESALATLAQITGTPCPDPRTALHNARARLMKEQLSGELRL